MPGHALADLIPQTGFLPFTPQEGFFGTRAARPLNRDEDARHPFAATDQEDVAIAHPDRATDRRRPAQPCLAPWQLRRAQEMLLTHLIGGIGLAEVAAECRLSIGYFGRAFTATVGVPPHRWLMQQRVERAKQIMRGSDQSIAVIAVDCGFSDQAHLTRVFARMEGITPARWRRIHPA